jgi:rare lipoprotein A
VPAVALLVPAVLSVVVLAVVDPRTDAAAPAAHAAERQTTGTGRPDAPRRVRAQERAPRPAQAADGWRQGPRGFATYYAAVLDGRRTASGTRFDNDDLVAAHPRLPFGTKVRVTNLRNGRTVIVTIVDRGPVRRVRAAGVIIDLSRAAAERLDFIEQGRARVRLEIRAVEDDEGDGN